MFHVKQDYMSFKIIAIDGPTGVGKSTIARQLAEKLNYLYVDTGAMFRCLAWSWKNTGCPEDEQSLQDLGDQTQIVFKQDRVFCNNVDVTAEIRSESISISASQVSRFPLIRQVMKQQQRKLVSEVHSSGNIEGAVLEGRDIGTVVFPAANFKFFVDASPEIRAKRRLLQLQERGEKTNYEEILAALIKRDEQDKNRKVALLRAAEDAIIVDTGKLNASEVLEYLLGCILR